jgi:hypothetical protein
MPNSVAALVLALAVTASTLAQSGSAEPQTGASRTALATVSDPRNRPIVDVSADDFVIQEGDASREILSVRPADYPIVVLLDTGVDARGDFPLMRKAVARFINRIGQRPLALGTFGNVPKLLTTFEDDKATVLAQLDAITAEATAGSQLMAGAALAGETVRATGSLFSAIVVVSATSADASRNAPDEMMAAVIDSGAILHVVANRSAPPSGAPGLRPGAALRALAEERRGEYTTIYSAESYQAALDRLADRLTSEMMIEYLVPVGSKPNDVKVGVRIVGAKVRGLGVAPR